MPAPPTRTSRREIAGSFSLLNGVLLDLGLRDLLVTPGQEAENVLCALRLAPRGGEMRALHHALGHRDDLLAYEDAEQPDQRHHRRRRRAHIEQAVDDADQEAGAERQKIDAHIGHLARRLTRPPTSAARA